jgi:hypothetical protein
VLSTIQTCVASGELTTLALRMPLALLISGRDVAETADRSRCWRSVRIVMTTSGHLDSRQQLQSRCWKPSKTCVAMTMWWSREQLQQKRQTEPVLNHPKRA